MTQKIFKYGITLALCLLVNVMTFAQNRNTTAELSTINTNQTATEGMLYFDTDLEFYQMGQSDGSLGTAPDRSAYKQTTAELDTTVSTNSVLPYILYWNTELKKYFKGLSASSISRASRFMQNLFSGDWFEDGHALDDSGDRPTKPGNDEIVFEKGYTFDGSDDYVIADSNITSYPFSVSSISNPTTKTNNDTIFSIADKDNTTKYFSASYTDGILKVFRRNSASPIVSSTLFNPTEKFTMTACFVNETTLIIYLNGVEVYNESSLTPVSIDSGFDSILIGSLRYTSPLGFHHGEIYDVKTYNNQRTPQQALSYHESFTKNTPDTTSTEGLVAHYKMDEGSGTTAIDSSGNGNDGTITNANLTTFHSTAAIPHPGNGTIQPGRAYLFDGVNDYVEIPDENIFDATNQLTLSAYIQADASQNGLASGIITKDDASGSRAYNIHLSSSNNWGVRFYLDGVGILTTSTDLRDNTAHHIAGTYDGNSMKIYVDGILEAENSVSGDITTNNQSLRIGNFNGTNNYDFNGKIWNTQIHDHPLSENEIQNIYNKQAVTTTPIAHYKMDESDGTTAYDSSGNENHGTITNADLSTFHATDSEGSDWANQFGYTEALINETAGTAYTESGAAYGTWEFDFNKQGTSNSIIRIITENNDGSGNRYSMTTNLNTIALYRDTNLLLNTANNYIQNDTLYRIKITRTTDGEFTMWIKGGSFGDTYTLVDTTGGAGTNPVTDNTYTISNYIVTDLDPGDQISNLTLDKNGLSLHDFTEGTGTYAKPLIPRDETAPTKDINGSDLQYSGRANYHAKLVGSHAGTFDGSGDYINIGSPEELDNPEKFSFYAKVKAPTSFGHLYGGYTPTPYIGIGVGLSATYGLQFWGGDGAWHHNANTTLSTNQWHEIFVTFDNGEVKGYIDGVLDLEDTLGAYNISNTGNKHLGARYDGDGSLEGNLVDVKIWNKVKTLDEARKTDQIGLVSHHPFAEGSGTTIYDASGNGNHGTLTTSNETAFWASTQDEYHYNLTKGFTLSGGTKIPADIHENGKDAQGNILSNPPGPYHNNAETLLQQYPAPQVISSDNLDGGDFWFDTNFDPKDMSHTEFTTNVSSRAHIKSTESAGDSSYQSGRWRMLAQ